jgi:hypothetical protein
MQHCTFQRLSPHFIATATRQQFENRPSGFRKLLAWVHQHGASTGLLFCLEHTAQAALRHLCSSPVLLFRSAPAQLFITIGTAR